MRDRGVGKKGFCVKELRANGRVHERVVCDKIVTMLCVCVRVQELCVCVCCKVACVK